MEGCYRVLLLPLLPLPTLLPLVHCWLAAAAVRSEDGKELEEALREHEGFASKLEVAREVRRWERSSDKDHIRLRLVDLQEIVVALVAVLLFEFRSIYELVVGKEEAAGRILVRLMELEAKRFQKRAESAAAYLLLQRYYRQNSVRGYEPSEHLCAWHPMQCLYRSHLRIHFPLHQLHP